MSCDRRLKRSSTSFRRRNKRQVEHELGPFSFNYCGVENAQRITADFGSLISDVEQSSKGPGQQIVEARHGSVIRGVRQERK